MPRTQWTLQLSVKAERDIKGILRWTSKTFGPAQARDYYDTLYQSILDLTIDPEPVDSKIRDDLTRGARTLHVGRKGRHGSHLVIFRVLIQQKIVEVIRILHDGMDPTRHIPRNK